MPTLSNKCTVLERLAAATNWALVFLLAAGSFLGCSDRSYAARAERHLGSVTLAAVETLRRVEERGDVDDALGRYAHEIREAELFLAGQTSHRDQDSYQKLSALIARHKEFLVKLQSGREDTPALPATDDGDSEAPSAPRNSEWIRTVNELLRETGEVRSLLRQGR
ncbi:MAG: hypothetical protein KatS3mg077_1211 [Candidatus Binatia bacterium]|nr:MAG: hypothetical protein KatS3mg077_1211 [Candidatus Binatia bacterium]